MLDISSLQYNSEHPTLMAIVFTVICAMILGTLIAFTYERTSNNVHRPDHFLQALVLVTIVSATIIQAIGDSVAYGLGMLGALSIIRFRTTVRDPRNIVFMFGAIAAGIACGVFGFVIAIAGTISFCITAFILRLTPFHKEKALVGTLKIEIPKGYAQVEEVEKLIREYSLRSKLKNLRLLTRLEKEHLAQREYRIKLKSLEKGEELLSRIKSYPEIRVMTMEFREPTFDSI
ncbi:MAG: DUF4956 domain-containing protein [Saprospiraceae bacterium]|nr:DUF4956 domain-containing protein [Saprospiraceae bacterium]